MVERNKQYLKERISQLQAGLRDFGKAFYQDA